MGQRQYAAAQILTKDGIYHMCINNAISCLCLAFIIVMFVLYKVHDISLATNLAVLSIDRYAPYYIHFQKQMTKLLSWLQIKQFS